MNVRLAIIQFLANEFHLAPENITEDTTFDQDLKLSDDQIADLLRNLQDALNISLPEETIGSITSVGDLFAVLEPEDENS